MNDLTDLRAAFAELERRADAHADAHAPSDTHAVVFPAAASARPRSRRRAVLVGATAAALLAAVAGSVVLTTGADEPAATVGSAASELASPDPGSPTPAVPSGSVATTADELATRFGRALAGLGTFTVTTAVDGRSATGPTETSTPSAGDPGAPGATTAASPDAPADDHDVLIAGVLTTAAGSGGYDVQTSTGATGPAACASDVVCLITTRADGSSLAVGTATVLAADGSADGGTTHEVTFVRPDGVEVVLHVGNQADPKGMSPVLAAVPPLTTAQMTTVVTSSSWVTG